MSRRWRPPRAVALILAVCAACIGLTACASAGDDAGAEAEQQGRSPGGATVLKITDGDTLRVRLGGAEERVRLIGIDTPETHGRGGVRECFGLEATRHLGRLVPPGTAIQLVRDVDARDRYGRLLAYVYRSRDDLFVNLAMAEDGFATTLTIPPNVAHTEEFVAAVRVARGASRGLWGRCGGPDTRLPSTRGQSGSTIGLSA